MDGICTLGNDHVYDQIIALLNSIEIMLGKQMPVCIYPYDDNTSKIAAAIAQRPQVTLYNDRDSIAKWDGFAKAAWDTHPTARQRWQQAGSSGYHRFGTHRRYCAFDGPFDRFLYMDADSLLLGSVESIFDKLEEYDCVVYDSQYKDPTHVYEVESPKLASVFPPDRVATEIFCSGFYAAKKELFPEQKRDWLITQLASGEAEILYSMAPDQTLINYMMMRSDCSIYNFARHLTIQEKTGCCVTSPHFEVKDNLVYDKGRRLTYLHYIGISSRFFNRLCQGENLDFPYRDVFLHYRYINEPETRPQLTGKAKLYNQQPNLATRLGRKLGLTK